ncbi:MAG: 50S ribosomal protein L31 [Actinomycetales bacterium]
MDVDISSASHPFWTGRGRVVDTEGRVAAFRRRYQKDRAGTADGKDAR